VASRADAVADPARLPAAPSLGGAIRGAFSAFYFNSWRLVPANLAWGAGLIALYGLALGSPVIALMASPLLALPTIGLFRLAALIVRGEPVALSDAFDAWRTFLAPALALGVAAVLAVTVFATNIVIGITGGGVGGWVIATLAAWGLLVTALLLLAVWPLLVDPWRADLPVRGRLRLAAMLVLAHPVRVVVLALLCGALLVVSTIAFAALIMVGMAFVAVLTTDYLLPAADRLEARIGGAVRRSPISE
jgi:hypothetical protein